MAVRHHGVIYCGRRLQAGVGFDRIGICLIDEERQVVSDRLNTDAHGNRYMRDDALVSMSDPKFLNQPNVRALLIERERSFVTRSRRSADVCTATT